MNSIQSELLLRLISLVGKEVNQNNFVPNMMGQQTAGPILLHTAHDGALKNGFVELIITGPAYEGVAKFEPKTDKLREVFIELNPDAYKKMFAYGRELRGRGYYWESKFLSSNAKLWSSGFYEGIWVLTVIFEKYSIRVMEVHRDTEIQRKM